MKYQRDLIGKKVLIIHSYLSIYFKSYCTYHIGKIKYYYPSCNLIIVECNDNINRTRFLLVDHDDPFAKKETYSYILGYNYSKNDGWYYVFGPNKAYEQLTYDLTHYKRKRCYNNSKLVIKTGSLLTAKERREHFTQLLNELKNESN